MSFDLYVVDSDEPVTSEGIAQRLGAASQRYDATDVSPTTAGSPRLKAFVADLSVRWSDLDAPGTDVWRPQKRISHHMAELERLWHR